jgi:hypothetical protein
MPERELSDIERELQRNYNPNLRTQFTSTALDPKESNYMQELALPDESRGRIPLTQEKFVINEDPVRVQWERECRKFLDALPGEGGHRVTATMIFEWTTGISIKELAQREGVDPNAWRGGAASGSANSHLRHINWILREYFGKSYKTTIAGRAVGKAYTVRPGFRVKLKRPANLTLWPEWENGTLRP